MTGRILHTMLRVGDLERSIFFYTEKLGMQMIRREEYPTGQFTLAFVGYGNEQSNSTIELTYNWGNNSYNHGSAFGHIAIAVLDIHAACKRLEGLNVKVIREPGPMNVKSPDRKETEIIAFIEDPDGYRIELIETKN
ncbi:MAG: lactoylglutathione lyase [Methylophilus sp.]